MKRLSREEFDQLASGAIVLSADEHGDKVLLTPDQHVIKLFRRKRLLSSAILRPYALRFARASRELAKRGIPAAMVEDVARVPAIKRDLIIYRHLDGVCLREALTVASERDALLERLANLLARLHDQGVYFRAAHFGNVLTPKPDATGDLALIDLSETRFRKRSLPPALRARNFRPMTRYPEDLAAIVAFGPERFVRMYLQAAGLSPRQESQFRGGLQHVHDAFAPCATPSSSN